MPMHAPAPVPLSSAFPFNVSEVHACAWACACTHVVLCCGEADTDHTAREFRRLLPDLPALLAALEAGTLTPAQAHTLATVLVALLEVRAQLAPNVWAALLPPDFAVLDGARLKALDLMGGAGPRLSVARA